MLEILVENYAYLKKEPVIKKIELSLKKGEITSIIGASGCGKSTFLRILMGMETGAYGFVRLNDLTYSLQEWNEDQSIFTLVPQIPHLLPWKNILNNIIFAISDKQMAKENKSKAEIALNALKIVQLTEHANKFPSEISLGMAQRVSFARALVMNSKAILLDEPFASLDAHSKYGLQQWLLQKIKETDKYAILVTHDVREALILAKEIHVIGDNPAIIKKSILHSQQEWNLYNSVEQEIIKYI